MEDKTESGRNSKISDKDRKLAQMCLNCPVCNYARRKQRGLIFWFVTRIESKYCPNGKAYEKVFGRKAHEPLSGRG